MGRGGEAKTLVTTTESSADYGSLHDEGVAALARAQIAATKRTDNGQDVRLPPPSSIEEEPQMVWPSLVVAVCMGLVAGSLYGFGRYAKDLRDALKVSQVTVQRFGILMDTGNYMGHPLTGWIYDNFGPRCSCYSAALVVFLSYSCIHLGLSSSAPIWLIEVGFMGVGFGSGLGYITALGSTTKLFTGTAHLGRAVGLVAAGYGFSSTLVGITYRHTGLDSFFLLWAVLVPVVNMIGAEVFAGNKSFPNIADVPLNSEEKSLLPLFDLHQESSTSSDGGKLDNWTSWKRLDFWLLFGSFASLTGCGLMIINNVSTMVQSIGGDDSLSDYLVVGLSMGNVLGRIVMGTLADHPDLNKLDLYRYASGLMVLAVSISAVGGTSSVCLVLTVALAAISYGGSWVLIIGVLADLYGKRNFGKDYGLIAMGPAISGMALNAVSARLYENNAQDDSGVCMGSICYRDAFLTTTASATLGFLILVWFLPSTGRPSYANRPNI